MAEGIADRIENEMIHSGLMRTGPKITVALIKAQGLTGERNIASFRPWFFQIGGEDLLQLLHNIALDWFNRKLFDVRTIPQRLQKVLPAGGPDGAHQPVIKRTLPLPGAPLPPGGIYPGDGRTNEGDDFQAAMGSGWGQQLEQEIERIRPDQSA